MSRFHHPDIQHYEFEKVPLDQDIYLMDEKWIVEFEAAMIASFGAGESAYSVGYYSPAAARKTGADSLELTWYPNIFDRFHSVEIFLPRPAFVLCIGSWQHDYKPIVFVRGDWLRDLYYRPHSVFVLVDAIGVKNALTSGALTGDKLTELRRRIDAVATDNPAVAFVSFADSLLMKSNYTVGTFDSGITYTYEPEKILRLLPAIRSAYQDVLGLGIYCVATQGHNEYYRDDLLHISTTRNHLSLNSLGVPFAQLQAIEHSARKAIRQGIHPPSDAYLDESFFRSIRFNFDFSQKAKDMFAYRAPMRAEPGRYVPISFDSLTRNLESPEAIEAARRRLRNSDR